MADEALAQEVIDGVVRLVVVDKMTPENACLSLNIPPMLLEVMKLKNPGLRILFAYAEQRAQAKRTTKTPMQIKRRLAQHIYGRLGAKMIRAIERLKDDGSDDEKILKLGKDFVSLLPKESHAKVERKNAPSDRFAERTTDELLKILNRKQDVLLSMVEESKRLEGVRARLNQGGTVKDVEFKARVDPRTNRIDGRTGEAERPVLPGPVEPKAVAGDELARADGGDQRLQPVRR